jgi:dTDP-4-amino-4,6-dideoxygalactose transaminase
MISFYQSYNQKESLIYIKDALIKGQLSGDGNYTKLCEEQIKKQVSSTRVLMMTSCTHALELAVRLLEIREGDEIIMPSFSYPSTANAVLLAGGKVVLTQVTKSHLLMDTTYLEEKITDKTRAIIVVHYGGNCCDMKTIMAIAEKYNLVVIEDAAQAYLSTYENQYAGTIGHIGCYSFHQTKNITAGEGGAILINDKAYIERATIMRQKGTNQWSYQKGLVNRYEWVDIGSSYSPSDLLMALLYGQLQLADEIVTRQVELFYNYVDFFEKAQYNQLDSFSREGKGCKVNGHLFYILFKSPKMAKAYQAYMAENEMSVYTHFVPLHVSLMGKQVINLIGDFSEEDYLGERLIRLPIYVHLKDSEQRAILEKTNQFFKLQGEN